MVKKTTTTPAITIKNLLRLLCPIKGFLYRTVEIVERRTLLASTPRKLIKVTIEPRKNSRAIHYVCSDMWRPYLKVIREVFPLALNILDRFHIAKKLNEAVDEVRKQETKELAQKGYEPVLKKSRYCFLKRGTNLTDNQKV